MSRNSLGKAGRTITRTVKVTGYELEYLERRYGSASAGLRAGLECLLPESVNHPGRAIRPKDVVNSQETLFQAPGGCGPRMGDHPGWKIVARGTKTRTVVKACRVCGVQVTERENS
jgi:hypothetical protein